MSENSQMLSMMPLYTALIALLGVTLGSFLTARFSFKNQFRLATYQSRQRSYAELMGKKFLLQQLYVSRFEALIFSDYHERRWNLSGDPPTSLDLDEAKRWMHKSEDFAIDIARTNQTLFESVGLARASFPPNDELERPSDHVYRFGTPTITQAAPGADAAALAAWKVKAVSDLQALVKREYSEPIDTLLVYLRKHMQDPVKSG